MKSPYRFLTITNSRLQFTTNQPLEEFLPTFEASSRSHIKCKLLFILLHRTFKLCSNSELFHHEMKKLKTIFENNGYPKSFVDLCIKTYLDKVFIKKEVLLKGTYLCLLNRL